MAKLSQPRAGSLQFWPRKRIDKWIPSVNWDAIVSEHKGIMGLIAYKVGMCSSLVKNSTPDSLTKDKKIIIPSTVLEIPPMRIFSVRYYKNGKVMTEQVLENEKELKRIVKVSKEKKAFVDEKDFDDIRVLVYSRVSTSGVKKTPDMTEIGLTGTKEEKLNFVKEKVGKDIFASEIFKDIKLVDIRGLTKGKGLVGPMKRFGIRKRQHKAEKGVRRPGTLGPWHPAHVLFRVPMSGQMGMFTRIHYNSRILNSGKISEKDINPNHGWKHYGKIRTEFVILEGSVPGPSKRQMLMTIPLRPSKSQTKKKYEFIDLR